MEKKDKNNTNDLNKNNLNSQDTLNITTINIIEKASEKVLKKYKKAFEELAK